MPKPRKGESRERFLNRCIPQVIEEGKPQKQAVAMCISMFTRGKEMSAVDKAKFRRFTYNGVSTQATSRRSSTRDDKAWMRTVRHNGNERLVHYADPDMPMRRNNPEARKNFLARHNCSSKKNPFAPGFWSCYDWANPSEKEVNMSDFEMEINLDTTQAVESLGEVEQKVEQVTDKVDVLDEKLKSMHGDVMEEEKDDYEYPMVTSFGELEAMEDAAIQIGMVRDLTNQFAMLAKNILMSEESDKEGMLVALANEYTSRVSDAMKNKERWQPLTDYAANFIEDVRKAEKPMKTEGGVKYPKADFAFTPSDKPSTWKLRMSEGRPGNITVEQLGRAAAAFSPGGFRGKKVQIPADKIAGVKAKLRAEYKKLDAEVPASIKKEQTSFMLWKEADGTYRFIANYSNNFRDSDNPPEIISEKSHKRFDEMVTKGEIPLPDVWLWHVPEWRIGKATGHAYDDSGFAIATGVIENKEVAEWLIEQEDNVLVSHGMPISSVVRDENDDSIIVEHITREISPLPSWAAANKLTGFVVLKEKEGNSMSIPNEKRDSLISQGLSATVLDALEMANQKTAQRAKESGLESKETELDQHQEVVSEQVETANENPTEEAQDVSGEDETPEVETLAVEEDVKESSIERTEIADAIIEAVQPLQDAIKALAEVATTQIETVKELKAELDDLKKSDGEKVAEKAAATPAASIMDLIRGKSVIGNKEAKVDGRTALAKSAPKEAEEKENETPQVTPIPFINQMLYAKNKKDTKLLQ